MEKFKAVSGRVIPLPLKDVDTDMIIPAEFLTSISRDGYGQNLFRRLREKDPAFPFNQERFKGAEILVADSNFGCGSSREHAVWALRGAGIKVVIAKSFADIFYNNAAKNSLLLVTLPSTAVEGILKDAESGTYSLTVDLEKQSVILPTGTMLSFDYDPFRKHCMSEGLDDVDYILSHKRDIEAFFNRRKGA